MPKGVKVEWLFQATKVTVFFDLVTMLVKNVKYICLFPIQINSKKEKKRELQRHNGGPYTLVQAPCPTLQLNPLLNPLHNKYCWYLSCSIRLRFDILLLLQQKKLAEVIYCIEYFSNFAPAIITTFVCNCLYINTFILKQFR